MKNKICHFTLDFEIFVILQKSEMAKSKSKMFPLPAVSGIYPTMTTPHQKVKQQSTMRQARSLLPILGQGAPNPFFLPPHSNSGTPIAKPPIPAVTKNAPQANTQSKKPPATRQVILDPKIVQQIKQQATHNQIQAHPQVTKAEATTSIPENSNPMLIPPSPASTTSQTKPEIDRGLLKKVFPRPVTPAREIDISVPELYNDEASNEKYGIRCVCNEQVDRGIMIQCEKCQYWLHAMCVNIARSLPNEKFLCPFCKNRPIRCTCGNKRKYDEPMIQCVKCKYWVHKSCANLGYGRNPPHFICSFCGGSNLSLPFYTLHRTLFNDFTITLDNTYSDLLEKIPNGMFKNFIIADINKKELHFNDTVARYFNAFAAPLFEEDIDFWSVFTSTLCEILQVDKKYLLMAIDNLSNQLMYENVVLTKPPLFVALDTFTISERAQILLQSMTLPKYEKPLSPVKVSFKNGGVRVESNVSDGGLICSIPGFMCHFFEAPSANGIKPVYISVPKSDFVIDTEGTGFSISQNIKRSFHYNCHPKLCKHKGEIKVLLFAHHMKGPLASKNKSKKGPAIEAGEELFLPFDSDLPWQTPNDEWMEKKQHKPQERHYRRRKDEKDNSPTLLSVFYPSDDISLPVKVLSEKNFKEKEEETIIKSASKILTRRQVQIQEKKNGI